MRLAACFLLTGWATVARAQAPVIAPDSLRRTLRLDEVVVTATRTEKALTQVPIPVMVVAQPQIKAMGALRLNEVLGEQTGLTIVADHGKGVQMQGLSPEYTLILVDGEPLIGRTAGTLELSRIAVGNIQRVEIVKGPASALWGSEALAGVVNIITQKPRPGTNATVSARYGANRTLDLGGTFNTKGERAGLTVFLNRYSSQGYTLQPESGTATIPPFANYTAQSRFTYKLGERTNLSVSGRYFVENQHSTLLVTGEDNASTPVRAESRQQDYTLNPVLTHRFSERFFSTARIYHSGYRTREASTYAADDSPYDASFFHQTFTRPELQTDWQLRPNQLLTTGLGYIRETVEATRYEQRQHLNAYYALGQYDWTPVPRLNVVAGARYDGHSQYPGQFSPKLSGRYQLTPGLALRGSAGRGYRAPDFRQLYLNFTNPVVGYSVFGTNQVRDKVAQLAAQGQLAKDPETGRPVVYEATLTQASNLTAESSAAYNIGVQLDPSPRLRLTVNAFRNELRNLIETANVALKANGQFVYSYRNVTQAFTQGADAEGQYQVMPGLTLSAGYQLLFAKDKAIIDQLKAGTIYRRDPQTRATSRVPLADYGGLYNRSRHTANVKLFYEDPGRGWSISLRGIYRGRYGYADLNGNGILDADPEYVRSYTIWNVAGAKTLCRRYTLQAGLDNVLNYTDPAYISTLPGRLYYASLSVMLGQRP